MNIARCHDDVNTTLPVNPKQNDREILKKVINNFGMYLLENEGVRVSKA